MSSSLAKAPAARMRALALALALAVAALVGVMLTSPARAGEPVVATFTVDRTDDPATPVGACTSAPNDCSLRGAIIAANTTTGEDEIEFSVDTVTLSIIGTEPDDTANAAIGDLDITQDLIINGDDVVIDTATGFNDRVFHVFSPADATISDVTVQGGSSDRGGGIFVRNGATADVADSTFEDNTATGFGGGAVFNAGTLNLTGSTLKDNTSSGGSGGGGILNATGGTANVADSTFEGNTAGVDGGGIFNNAALEVTGSTFTGNTATGVGGGLESFFGSTTVTNSTFSGNNTSSRGGGVHVVNGRTQLTNVTIADNEAPNSSGGGISNNTTTGSNPADALRVKNTIVADNTQGENGQCGGVGVTSQGGNLEFPADDSCPFEVQGDPDLGPLADNGGPTQTRALDTGSAAIDAGTNNGCPDTDQRGVERPQNGDDDATLVCDIGAFELEETGTPSLSLDDAPAVTEGDSGTTDATFAVTLSKASSQTVTVDYETADGSANAGSDYVGESGTLTFEPGQTEKTITVAVNDDTEDEPDEETFEVNLSEPSNATIDDGEATGTIIDDDAVVQPEPDTTDPTITDLTPPPGSTTNNNARNIEATVRDDRSELSKQDIRLFVDGRERGRFSYDPEDGRLVFDKMRKLGVGKHSVRIEATDEAGNTAKERWTFKIK